MEETLQQIADREGVTRQAVWARTEKGKAYHKAYQKAYQKSEKRKAYMRDYTKAYRARKRAEKNI
jgi:predicted DNA-binding protein YlxM (UPF0122 family)